MEEFCGQMVKSPHLFWSSYHRNTFVAKTRRTDMAGIVENWPKAGTILKHLKKPRHPRLYQIEIHHDRAGPRTGMMWMKKTTLGHPYQDP